MRCYGCREPKRFLPYEIRVKEESKKTVYYFCSATCLLGFARQLESLESAAGMAVNTVA